MAKTIKDKQALYRTVLGNPAGREVLTDLNVFCNGTKTHGTNDPMELMRFEGRREVFLQIMRMIKVDIHTVFEEYVEEDF